MHVMDIAPRVRGEAVDLDRHRIAGLMADLGEAASQRMMRRVLGEISDRLARAEDAVRGGNMSALRKSAARIVVLADQVGLSGLAHIAHDVTHLADAGPDALPARAACAARLRRVGDASVHALWEFRDDACG